MANLNFEEVDLLIADEGTGIRAEIKRVFRHEGFREINEVGKFSEVKEAVDENKTDVMIIDHALPGGDICDLTHQIRHHEVGDNPFVIIIIMAQDPTRDEALRIIDCGSDYLLLKPVSAGVLAKCVTTLVNDRKNFVVTSEYIGPTRRHTNRPGTEQIPELEVPNPLQAKSAGEIDLEALQAQIDSFSSIINEQKMGREAIQIAYLVDRIVPIYASGEVDDSISTPLDRLQYVSEDISRRLTGTAYDHVGELCSSMVSVVQNIRKSPLKPPGRDLQLLPELAQAINAAFSAEGAASDLARDISSSVQGRSQNEAPEESSDNK